MNSNVEVENGAQCKVQGKVSNAALLYLIESIKKNI